MQEDFDSDLDTRAWCLNLAVTYCTSSAGGASPDVVGVAQQFYAWMSAAPVS